MNPRQCPFCDSLDLSVEADLTVMVASIYFVKCRFCKAQGPRTSVIEDATKRWNEAPRPGEDWSDA